MRQRKAAAHVARIEKSEKGCVGSMRERPLDALAPTKEQMGELIEKALAEFGKQYLGNAVAPRMDGG